MNFFKRFLNYSANRILYSVFRLLFIIGIAYISFLLGSKELKALTQSNYNLNYNYYDDKILNTVDPNFTGINGYLEMVRVANDKRNDIFFTSDDIYVFAYNRTLWYSLDTYNNKSYAGIYSADTLMYNPVKLKYIKYSDYNNINTFLEAIQKNDFKELNSYDFEATINTYSNNLNNSSYNYFSYTDGDYFIYYDGRYSSEGIPISGAYSNYFQKKVIINNIIPSASAFMPSYYELYGYIGTDPMLEILTSIDYEIPISELASFNTNIEVTLNTARENFSIGGSNSFSVYGKKVVNGELISPSGEIINQSYYYYEDLTAEGSSSGCYLDADDYGYTTTTAYYKNLRIHTCYVDDITDYESIYLRVNFNDARDIVNIVNDYSSSGSNAPSVMSFKNQYDKMRAYVYQKNYLTRNNALVLSTPLSIYNSPIYYGHARNTYNGVNYETTNLSKFNYSTKETLPRSLTGIVLPEKKQYNVDSRLAPNQFGAEEKTAIYFWANNNLQDNEIAEFYTVTNVLDDNGDPAIYFGGGSINSSYDGFSGTFIDQEGNITTDENIQGDFTQLDDNTTIGEAIIESIQLLFVPSDSFFTTYLDKVDNFFSKKLGVVYLPFDLLIDFGLYIANLDENYTTGIIHIPNIHDPIYNKLIIKEQDFNLKSIFTENEVLKGIYEIYLIIVDVGLIVGLSYLGYKKFIEIVGGDVN